MVTKDIDQENSLKGNVQEKLKGVDYELPIIRETPDPLKRWRLNLVQADEEKLILDYIGASYSMYLGSMLMFGGGDRKSTRLNSSHTEQSRMPSSA